MVTFTAGSRRATHPTPGGENLETSSMSVLNVKALALSAVVGAVALAGGMVPASAFTITQQLLRPMRPPSMSPSRRRIITIAARGTPTITAVATTTTARPIIAAAFGITATIEP